jgi:hypothetical protein
MSETKVSIPRKRGSRQNMTFYLWKLLGTVKQKLTLKVKGVVRRALKMWG